VENMKKIKENIKVIIIDNYDSFTYNLVHIVEEILAREITVKRNDEITIKELEEYDKIILSPGPGIPEEAGKLKKIIEELGSKKDILGVCLGLQAIGEVYGCQLKNLEKVYHGISTQMYKTAEHTPVLEGLDTEFTAGRYHSWVIDKDTINDEILITAEDAKGEIMAIQHVNHRVYGVQFHPESIMTPDGHKIIENFLSL
jgi:anthranilate synthase component 2